MKNAKVRLYEFRGILLAPLGINNAHGLSFNVLLFQKHFHFPVRIFQMIFSKNISNIFTRNDLLSHASFILSELYSRLVI